MHVSSQYQYYVMLGSAHKKTENQIEHPKNHLNDFCQIVKTNAEKP